MMRFCLWLMTAAFCVVSANALSEERSTREWPFHDIHTGSEALLSDGWSYAPDPDDIGMDEGWFEPGFSRENWIPVTVPGVWDGEHEAIPITAQKKVGWYARELEPPAGAEKPALVFLGAMFITDVWLDGEYIGGNFGGYTPFMLCLAGRLAPGGTGRLVVRVDSRLSDQTVPRARTGWDTYGGLTREVFLITRPRLRVEDLRTECTVEGPDGPVRLRVSGVFMNDTGEDFSGSLRAVLGADDDEVGRETAEILAAAGESGSFEVVFDLEKARLWSPRDPYLHSIQLRREGVSDALIRMPVGLREVRVEGGHFMLNGERLWLQGFGQHEMVPGYGPCIPPGWHETELERIRRFGANHFRTGHYPQHPEVYAAADRLGLLVFTEIPVWQHGRAWIQTDAAWEEWVEPQLSAMIDWYRNFTSVVSWGAANEMGGTPLYNRRAVDFIRERDPARLPMIVLAAGADLGDGREEELPDDHIYALLPMAGRNFHYGWYHSRRVYALREGLARNLEYARRVDAPIWVAELGGLAMPGRFAGYNVDDRSQSETYLDKIVRFGFQYNAVASERISGIAIWTWSDFVRGGVHRHGIMCYERAPKLVAYAVRNLFEGDLRLYLTEEDTACEPGGVFRADAFVFNPYLLTLPQGLSVRWRILRGREVAAEGSEAVYESVSGRAISAGEIKWDIPEDARGMYSLWAELTDSDGRRVHTNAVHFGVGEPPERPGALFVRVTSGGDPVNAEATLAGVSMPVYADPGLFIPLAEGRYDLLISFEGESRSL